MHWFSPEVKHTWSHSADIMKAPTSKKNFIPHKNSFKSCNVQHWTSTSCENRKVKKHLIRFTQVYFLMVPSLSPRKFQL